MTWLLAIPFFGSILYGAIFSKKTYDSHSELDYLIFLFTWPIQLISIISYLLFNDRK